MIINSIQRRFIIRHFSKISVSRQSSLLTSQGISMVDDSIGRQSTVSNNLPIDGMKSVVATVTGYKGTERFNLIKLISKSGANYVGNMYRSITHLVCWKFEGEKYKIARKLRIKIVNHQWVEDCIKKGRRLPEDPYSLQCGREVGPLLLNISMNTDKPQLELDKCRLKRKAIKQSPEQARSSDIGYSFDEPLSPRLLSMEEKRHSGLAESSVKHRKRRLVKKDTREILEITSDSEQSNHRLSDFQKDTSAFSNNLDTRRHEDLYDSTGGEHRSGSTEFLNDLKQVEDVDDVLNCENQSPPLKDITASNVRDVILNVTCTERAASLPASTELSCVICYTDFSARRGVLPCGHRFCYLCIRRWTDQRNEIGKNPTCPICNTIYKEIIEVEAADSSDQKIYTQTIPYNDVMMVHAVPDVEAASIRSHRQRQEPSVCIQCNFREPEDLLISCHICQRYCIHSYCLDPPIHPWACSDCRGLRRLLFN